MNRNFDKRQSELEIGFQTGLRSEMLFRFKEEKNGFVRILQNPDSTCLNILKLQLVIKTNKFNISLTHQLKNS